LPQSCRVFTTYDPKKTRKKKAKTTEGRKQTACGVRLKKTEKAKIIMLKKNTQRISRKGMLLQFAQKQSQYIALSISVISLRKLKRWQKSIGEIVKNIGGKTRASFLLF